ncbi:hypothetical protein [Streptomyces sp. N35]|uniref:DUF6197 family protein n=1 Tax=Streptomyces sp. N35 TaxID=2795730 RepID=UPI0018F62E56|nr:hypothetical protein [Streptomyces sp. N35]
MNTITEPSAAEIADDLDRAADVLDANGLHKGSLYDGAQRDRGTPADKCRVCVYGALNIAITGQPRWTGKDEDTARSAAAGNAIAAHLGLTPNEVAEEWSDDPKRRKAQVVKALRDTAAGLRKAVAA